MNEPLKILEKFQYLIGSADMDISGVLDDDIFLKELKQVFKKDVNDYVLLLKKIFSYEDLTDEEYKRAVELISMKSLSKVFTKLSTKIPLHTNPSYSLLSLGLALETSISLSVFGVRLNQLYREEKMGDEFIFVGEFSFPVGRCVLFKPSDDTNGFYFLHVEGFSNPLISCSVVNTSEDRYIIFNNISGNVVYIYSEGKKTFSQIEGKYFTNRDGIPSNIIEVAHGKKTIYLDLETDLCFHKEHSNPSEQVKNIFETPDDNIALHTSITTEDRLDKTSVNSNGEYYESRYIFWQDRLNSMVEGKDIFAYDGEILDFLSCISNNNYVIGYKEFEKMTQIIDISNGEVIDEFDSEVKHYTLYTQGSELVIIKYTREGVAVSCSGTNQVIEGGSHVSNVHYYERDGIIYTGLSIHYSDGQAKIYNIGNQDGKTVIEEDFIESLELKDDFQPDQDVLEADYSLDGMQEDNSGLLTYKNYGEKLSTNFRIERYLKRLYTQGKKVHLGESKRIILELISYSMPQEILESIQVIISAVGLDASIVKILESYHVAVYQYRGDDSLDNNDFVLVQGSNIIHNTFGIMTGLTEYNVINGNKESYIGNVKTKTGTFLLNFSGNSFEYCYLFQGEKNTISVNGKSFKALENTSGGLDLLDEESGIIIKIGFSSITIDQDVLDAVLDKIIDGRMRKYRIALFLDENKENYVLFDGNCISEVMRVPSRHYSNLGTPGNNGETILH